MFKCLSEAYVHSAQHMNQQMPLSRPMYCIKKNWSSLSLSLICPFNPSPVADVLHVQHTSIYSTTKKAILSPKRNVAIYRRVQQGQIQYYTYIYLYILYFILLVMQSRWAYA